MSPRWEPTRWYNNGGTLKEYRAKYSSGSEGIDIHASGSLGYKDPNVRDAAPGTSLAAPRVAAAMATVHKLNPSWSSDQVEKFVQQNLTHQLTSDKGELAVLDYNKTFEFLKGNVY